MAKKRNTGKIVIQQRAKLLKAPKAGEPATPIEVVAWVDVDLKELCGDPPPNGPTTIEDAMRIIKDYGDDGTTYRVNRARQLACATKKVTQRTVTEGTVK